MIITWLGHSCFKIDKDGYIVIFDPYGDGTVPGLSPVREEAHMVICSHEHGDHNGRENVKILPERTCPFQITQLNGYHDSKKGLLRGKNKMTILDDGESRIAHLGDIGSNLTRDQIEECRNLDVLMIPVGGFFTIDAKKAARIVRLLEPKKVIPMHYRDDQKGFGFNVIAKVEKFTKEFDKVAFLERSSIDTEKGYGAQIVVLKPELAGK